MPVFTLTDLRTKVLARLDTNDQLYTTPEIDFVINECLRTAALFTGFCRVTAPVPGGTVAGQLVYATPAAVLAPLVVTLAGRQLQRLTLPKLARLRRNWASDTTAAKGRVDYWAPIGISQFVISPRESLAGRTLSVTGMGTPALLDEAEDVISIENEYVDLITEYCAHRLPLKEGGKVFADGSLSLNDFYAVMKQRKIFESLKAPKYWLLEPKKEAAQ